MPRRIILLLLLPIGDTLFATPTIRALRRSHPDARIVALAYPTNAGILAANPDIDRLILHPTAHTWKGWPTYLGFLWRLNRMRFDLLVQFAPGQWWMTQLLRPHRYRHLAFPVWQWFFPFGPRPWRLRHAVTSYATLLTSWELPNLPAAPVLTATPKDRATVATFMAALGERPVLAIHPGGEGFRGMKRWPPARFTHLAKTLCERHNAHAVVLGGGDETDLAARVASQIPGALSLAGRLDLGQTIGVLERCFLFVGNDSAPLHMAAALGIPTVGIFGPTNPLNFRPRGPRVRVVRSGLGCSPCFHFVGSHSLWTGSRCRVPSCLHGISTGAVLAAVEELVSTR